MKNSFRCHFERVAGVMLLPLAIAGQAVAQQTDDVPAPPVMNFQKLTCQPFKDVKTGSETASVYIRSLFTRAELSFEQPTMDSKVFTVCFNPSMGDLAGSYRPETDYLYIDVSNNTDDIDRVMTTAHELRHRTHLLRGANVFDSKVNVHTWERIALYLVSEIDARIEEILLAKKKEREGYPEFVQEMKKDAYSILFINAYERSMQEKPGDDVAAMQAVAVAVLDCKDMIQRINKDSQEYYGQKEQQNLLFNPEKPRETLLGATLLRRLVDRDGVNYMDDGLISKIRSLDTILLPVVKTQILDKPVP